MASIITESEALVLSPSSSLELQLKNPEMQGLRLNNEAHPMFWPPTYEPL